MLFVIIADGWNLFQWVLALSKDCLTLNWWQCAVSCSSPQTWLRRFEPLSIRRRRWRSKCASSLTSSWMHPVLKPSSSWKVEKNWPLPCCSYYGLHSAVVCCFDCSVWWWLYSVVDQWLSGTNYGGTLRQSAWLCHPNRRLCLENWQ